MTSSISRRKLLTLSTLAPLTTLSIPTTSWSQPSSLHPQQTKITPLNAANLAPAFNQVLEKQTQYSQSLNQDVSFIHRRAFIKDQVENTRDKVATMLNTKADNIAFVRNTSEANSTIVHGLDLKPTDEVILWDQNHSTNLHSWRYQQQRTPFIIKEISLPQAIDSTDQIINAFIKKLTPNTKVVTFTELSNISGVRLPSQAICNAVRDYNKEILIHVDGAQSWGCLDVNLTDMDCDSFSASAHKWLMGPRGTGILFIKQKWAKQLWPNTLGYEFLFDYPTEELPKSAQRFECLGQRDVAAYAAIGTAIDQIQQLGGMPTIENYINEITHYALSQLTKKNIAFITPKARKFGHGVVVIDLKSSIKVYGAFLALHNAGIASAFIQGSRVCCEPEQPPSDDLPTYLRLSPHIYNSKEDIDRAIAVIDRINQSPFEVLKETIHWGSENLF